MLSAFILPWVETRLLPTLTRAYPCRFTFDVADPVSSIQGPQATPCPQCFAIAMQAWRLPLPAFALSYVVAGSELLI
jgi:hypothetical protein